MSATVDNEQIMYLVAAQHRDLSKIASGESILALIDRGLLDKDRRLTKEGRMCATVLTTVGQREVQRFSRDGYGREQ